MLHLMKVETIGDFDKPGRMALTFCDPDLTFQSQAEFVKDKNHNPGKYTEGRYTFWDDSRPIFDLVEPPRQLTMQIVEPEEKP